MKLPVEIRMSGLRRPALKKVSELKKTKTKYEQIIDLGDERINVLLLGTSGCGKSTLINAILGEERADAGTGNVRTREIAVYQDDALPFRMIDTIGYEYGFLKQNRIKSDIQKFVRSGVKSRDAERLIHMIWFCVDGTVRRLDNAILEYVRIAARDWKDVPVIIVFTKSYSEQEVLENIRTAENAVWLYNEKHPRNPLNVKDILPVVAKPYPVSEEFSIPARGLDTLVQRTIELAPEAKQLAASSIRSIDLKMKRKMSNSIILGSAAAAAVVGAVPIPTPDAAVLVPLQTAMLMGIAKNYGLQDQSKANMVVNKVLEVGATTVAGRSLLNTLKGIPGLNLAASVLNAAVAGTVTLAAGEISTVLFERIYTGDIDFNSVDWETEVALRYRKYLPKITAAVKAVSEANGGKLGPAQIRQLLAALLKQEEPDRGTDLEQKQD
ncbi:MAG: 50S ribosome-binding GTPase [Lachnospiraceae bacterium]|nr:50S ribosome-binding GTPase [Lachnospiraceae bacterium]